MKRKLTLGPLQIPLPFHCAIISHHSAPFLFYKEEKAGGNNSSIVSSFKPTRNATSNEERTFLVFLCYNKALAILTGGHAVEL